MVESRTKNSSKNIIFSSFSAAFIFLLNYATRIIFVRFLDAAYLGINGLFTDIISILSMADLGIVTAMMFSLYKPLMEKDEKKITQLVNFFKKIYNIIAIVVLLLGLLLVPFLKLIINLENDISHIYIYYLLFLFETVLSYLFVYRTTLLNADQKNYVLVKWNMLIQVARFVFRIVVLILFKNYILYILIGVIINLIGNFIQNKVAYKYYPFLKIKQEELSSAEKKEVFSNVKSTFIYKLCSVLQTNSSSIIISIFVGTIVVGYYSNYLLVVNAITSLITLVFSSIKSSVGNFLVEGKTSEEKNKLFNALELIAFWIVSFCSIAFYVLFDDFILISYGNEYIFSKEILILIIVNFYTSNIRQNVWTFRETTKIFHKTKYFSLVTTIVNIILSIILGKMFGLFGILLSIIISKMIYSFWKETIILYKDVLKNNPTKYFVNFILRVLLTTLLCILIDIICNLVKINNIYFSFLYKILIVSIVPNLLYLIIYFKNKDFKFILNKIKYLVKSRGNV